VLLELLLLVELLEFEEVSVDGVTGSSDKIGAVDAPDGTELVFLLVFTFTSKSGAPRLMFPVANFSV